MNVAVEVPNAFDGGRRRRLNNNNNNNNNNRHHRRRRSNHARRVRQRHDRRLVTTITTRQMTDQNDQENEESNSHHDNLFLKFIRKHCILPRHKASSRKTLNNNQENSNNYHNYDDDDDDTSKLAQKFNNNMVYLEGPQVYSCIHCRTHFTSNDDIVSKSFHGRHGRAILFTNCVNVTLGKSEDRLLLTGLHTVCDLFCKRCQTLVGWTYTKAFEPSQQYKEGKFIVEKYHLHLEDNPYYYQDITTVRSHYGRRHGFSDRSYHHYPLDNNNIMKNHDRRMESMVYEYE